MYWMIFGIKLEILYLFLYKQSILHYRRTSYWIAVLKYCIVYDIFHYILNYLLFAPN
jgi:hypothetical protein